MKEIFIKDEYIKLDSLLKYSGLISTGGIAKAEIQSGKVLVNGEVCVIRGKKLRNNDIAEYNGTEIIVKNEDR